MQTNLLKRIVTSIFLLTILLFVNFSNDLIFILSILLIGIIVSFETYNMFSKLLTISVYKKVKNTKKLDFRFLLFNLITFFYIFFIFCQYSYEIHTTQGSFFFLYIISICFFTDIGGYVFGKTIGGRKLTEISPNKTISGTFGSFIFSLIPLLLFLNLGFMNLVLNLENIIFCLLISLVSQLGDLFISYLKRRAKIKDTGKILPGHGGMLDRVDGIIFAVPFSNFLMKLF